MTLHQPLDSQAVGRCAQGPGPASPHIADSTLFAAAGQAWVEVESAPDDIATVRLAGELDVASAPLVEHAVQQAHAARRHHVRLDLGAVSFCDCAGLSAIMSSDRLLRAAGSRLTLRHLSAPVRRLLALTNMDCVLALAE